MGCGSSQEVQPKRRKSTKRNFTEIHQCSRHSGCRDVAIVSPFIQGLDGSEFRVSWAPCGLEFAREYIRERAADPNIADLLSNDQVAAEPPRGRSRQARPVPPERARMSGAGGTVGVHDEVEDDDMVHDVGDPGDPYAGENIAMGPVPAAFPEDDMVHDLPVPPPEAHISRRRRRGKKPMTVPGPFGEPVPAPGQGGMMYDDPSDPYGGMMYDDLDDPYGGASAGGQGMPYAGGYHTEEGMGYPGESSGMGHAATGAYGDNSRDSWAGSTVAPKPPRPRWVENRHENFYRGDEFVEGRYLDPEGVAVAQEERAPPRTANYDYNVIKYSMDYKNS